MVGHGMVSSSLSRDTVNTCANFCLASRRFREVDEDLEKMAGFAIYRVRNVPVDPAEIWHVKDEASRR
jgi:hypothetical protein